jgi:hypothetical protein
VAQDQFEERQVSLCPDEGVEQVFRPAAKLLKKSASAAEVPGPGEAGICRAVRVFLRGLGQKPLDRILPDVILKLLVFARISDPPIHKAWLPDVSFNFQVVIQPERESTLHQLQGPFQGDLPWSNDHVEMVRHDNKFMQPISSLCSVLQQDFNEEPGNFLHLKKALSF